MDKRRARLKRLRVVPLLVMLTLLVGGAIFLLLRLGATPPTQGDLTPAPTDACRGVPAFTQNLGLGGALALATDQSQRGLVLRATDGSGAFYQHPTWGAAGYLGAIAYDGAGNVYAAPTPRLSLADNPLAGATTLWRVDGATGVMAPLVTLPGAATERNPFGVLGLTYTCALDALYAGTVIGSTPTSERGSVVVIERNGQLRGVALAATDVLGVLVVRVGTGYTLYAGLARSPQVVAVPLDERGLAAGPGRPLLDLTAAGAAPSERARKLRLSAGTLEVDLVPFNFSLQSNAAAQLQPRRATWRYDGATDTWVVNQAAVGP